MKLCSYRMIHPLYHFTLSFCLSHSLSFSTSLPESVSSLQKIKNRFFQEWTSIKREHMCKMTRHRTGEKSPHVWTSVRVMKTRWVFRKLIIQTVNSSYFISNSLTPPLQSKKKIAFGCWVCVDEILELCVSGQQRRKSAQEHVSAYRRLYQQTHRPRASGKHYGTNSKHGY